MEMLLRSLVVMFRRNMGACQPRRRSFARRVPSGQRVFKLLEKRFVKISNLFFVRRRRRGSRRGHAFKRATDQSGLQFARRRRRCRPVRIFVDADRGRPRLLRLQRVFLSGDDGGGGRGGGERPRRRKLPNGRHALPPGTARRSRSLGSGSSSSRGGHVLRRRGNTRNHWMHVKRERERGREGERERERLAKIYV